MPQRDLLAYLDDIANSINEIEMGVVGLQLDTYQSVRQIRSAVEREFMIIGEALRQLLSARPDLSPRISAATDVIAFRNHLAHGYFMISDETVWGIIKGHLPTLKSEIAMLKTELEAQSD